MNGARLGTLDVTPRRYAELHDQQATNSLGLDSGKQAPSGVRQSGSTDAQRRDVRVAWTDPRGSCVEMTGAVSVTPRETLR